MQKISVLFNDSLDKELIDFSVSPASDLLEYASSKVTKLLSNICCLLAVIISFIMGFEYDKIYKKAKIKVSEKEILRIIVVVVLFMLLPIVLVCIVLSLVYKSLCAVIIKSRDKNFVKFLDSFDVFWCLEDNANSNIIEVLGIIQADCPYALVDKIREKLEDVISNKSVEKIFYRRQEQFGFYYWRKNDDVNINQYVKLLNVTNKNSLNPDDLESLMSELTKKSLPYNGEGLFEILITDIELNDEGDLLDSYAIIFRIHHSVGDGIALIEFLCEILADDTSQTVQLFKAPEVCNLFDQNMVKDIAELTKTISEMILCAVEGVIRKPDINSLHGPTLEGKKIFKWIDSNDNLLQMIKHIKEKQDDLNFSDILATALSNGLRKYFSQTMLYIPEHVAVIIPIRLSTNEDTLILENNFTVSILDLPLNNDLRSISTCCNRLRRSLDPMTNHYLLKLCNVFPNYILEQVFNSDQATMVFSNIPGPKRLSICGCVVKSLVFFVPNKGTTGVGVTALCYGGVLRFAVMADSALLSRPEDLSNILDGMVEEIKRLYAENVAV
ncbi:uncharacterized protein LOC119840845 [Zerene cesonia]|uniref:uncharacterized protein LOC119840845 n=1 Tax=Zerene cesonia TaxID=33412 RepID=UPI0018E54BFD|nr:uncharacterized protein LOC119840845 [Zerene cesonia]